MSCLGIMYTPYTNTSTPYTTSTPCTPYTSTPQHYVPSPQGAAHLPAQPPVHLPSPAHNQLPSPNHPSPTPSSSSPPATSERTLKIEQADKEAYPEGEGGDVPRVPVLEGPEHQHTYPNNVVYPRQPYTSPKESYVPVEGREAYPTAPTSQEYDRSSLETYPQVPHEFTRRGTETFPSPGEGVYPSPNPHSGSGGSCGAPTPTPAPTTPISPSQNSHHESEGDESVSPVYLARNVVVYTSSQHSGDVGSLVDLHFTRALNNTGYTNNKVAPMASRNLPPSFFNANYRSTFPTDLYPEYASSLHHLAAHASQDPWQYAAQASSSSYHRSMQDLYNRGTASQYSALFLNSASRLPVKTETPWGGPEYSAPSAPADFSHALTDRGYGTHPYANMTQGVEGAHDTKDIYWPTF